MVQWAKRGFKLLGAFFTGYSGGFSVMVPANLTFAPGELNWFNIITLPILAGLVVTFPQLGKTFNELGSMGDRDGS